MNMSEKTSTISTRTHGMIDASHVLSAVATPQVMGFGSRTTAVLGAAAAAGVINAALTDYEFGLVPLMPMEAHLAADAVCGLGLIAAAVTLLANEPPAERLMVAALGACELLSATMTEKPHLERREQADAYPSEPVPAADIPESVAWSTSPDDIEIPAPSPAAWY